MHSFCEWRAEHEVFDRRAHEAGNVTLSDVGEGMEQLRCRLLLTQRDHGLDRGSLEAEPRERSDHRVHVLR